MAKQPSEFDDLRRALVASKDASAAGDEPKNPVAPTFEGLLLDTPLYAPVEATKRSFLADLRARSVQIDAYCVECKKDSVFRNFRSYGGGAGTKSEWNWMYKPGRFTVELSCQRDASHKYTYFFDYRKNQLTKIGQTPSMEDISGSDVDIYRKLLPRGEFAELKRAGGLASHGVGIGSFVYLRRLFERLVQQHHDEFVEKNAKVADFGSLRMDEKIAALKDVLPEALVENRKTYSILSVGIHELDENTCLAYFPVVRKAIIAILDQDLSNRRKQEQAEALNKEITQIAGELTKNAGK